MFLDDPFVGEIWMRFKSVHFRSNPSFLGIESFEADKICDNEFSKVKEMASMLLFCFLTIQVQEQKVLTQQRKDPVCDVR